MATHFLKTFLILFAFAIFSCGNSEDSDQLMECPDDALHTIDNAKGSMIYMSCYDAWGVLLDEALVDENRTIGVSVDIDDSFKTEGLRVQVDACFYEFDLPLIFPDPAFWGYLYKMEKFRVIEE